MSRMARAATARARARMLGWGVALLLAGGVAGTAGAAAAASYIDAGLGEIKPADKVVIANPQPVQLLFEFQTKGALNGRGTKLLKDKVFDAVKSTGLFSTVSDMPVPNGAVLEITINDAPKPEEFADAEGKGFVTGATFFIAGSTVHENYISTVSYVAGPSAAKITRTVNDGIYFQLGLINSPPANAVKIGTLTEALYTLVRYVVINPLNSMASDPGFTGATSAVAAAPSAPAPPMATSATAATNPPSAGPPLASPPAAMPAAAPAPAPAPAPATTGSAPTPATSQ